MHVHNVYFWLRNDLDSQAIESFEQGLRALAEIPLVKYGYFGKPADTYRDVVDNSYSYGIVFIFDNLEDHNQYQADPVHVSFVDEHVTKWERVVVYDIQST